MHDLVARRLTIDAGALDGSLRGRVVQTWSVAEVLRCWFNTVNCPGPKQD